LSPIDSIFAGVGGFGKLIILDRVISKPYESPSELIGRPFRWAERELRIRSRKRSRSARLAKAVKSPAVNSSDGGQGQI
jgi:hypothetical protein